MRKIFIIGALAALTLFTQSCQLNVGEEVSNPKMGDITYTKDANGNAVAKADNTSGSDLEAQFLDDNKDPIGGKSWFLPELRPQFLSLVELPIFKLVKPLYRAQCLTKHCRRSPSIKSCHKMQPFLTRAVA
jgi:hypothetical protein